MAFAQLSGVFRRMKCLPRGLLLAASLLGASPAFAKTPVRTHATAQAGTDVRVHPHIAIGVHAQLRLADLGDQTPDQVDKAGVFARVHAAFALHEVMRAEVGYGYGYGRFPIEGTMKQEHRGDVGFVVGGTGGEGGFSISNRTRVDLRVVLDRPGHWSFRARPRNEVRLLWSRSPRFGALVAAEGLVEPPFAAKTWLQLRASAALFGKIALGRRGDDEEPRTYMQWVVGNQWVAMPLSLGRVAKAHDAITDLTGGTSEVGSGGYLESVFTGGLSLLF